MKLKARPREKERERARENTRAVRTILDWSIDRSINRCDRRGIATSFFFSARSCIYTPKPTRIGQRCQTITNRLCDAFSVAFFLLLSFSLFISCVTPIKPDLLTWIKKWPLIFVDKPRYNSFQDQIGLDWVVIRFYESCNIALSSFIISFFFIHSYIMPDFSKSEL